MIAYGQWTEPYVDAEPARERLREMQAVGIGWRRAGELTGLSASRISAILFGQAGRKPASRIRPATEAAILAVHPAPELALPGARVDAVGTRRRIQALVATGRPLAEVARMLGKDPRPFGKILSQPTVTAETAAATRTLYDRIGERLPEPATPRERYRAEAARQLAARNGWAPPMAWDPSLLDKPDASPAEGWQDWQPRQLRGRERWAAIAEDAEFMARKQDLTPAQIAGRLGISEQNLTSVLIRHREAEAADLEREHGQQRIRFAEAADAEAGGGRVAEAEAG